MIATMGEQRLSLPEKTTGLRVVIAEDIEDCAESMALLLRIYGHEVEVARNGQTALAMVKTSQPDVLLLDIGLPGMDGYEVAQRLNEQLGQKKTIIIAVTGYGQERDLRRSADAGIDLHLTKPVDPEQLRKILARFPDLLTECRPVCLAPTS